jgi:hypothetical protein
MSEKKNKGGAPRKPDPNADYNPVLIGALTDTAFGLAKLPTGQNVIVKIPYNPLTGDVGTPELQIYSGSMTDAEYEMREQLDQYIDVNFISKAG